MNKCCTHPKTEFVVTYHGQTGTWRTAYLSEVLAIADMRRQLAVSGTMVAAIEERERKTYSAEAFPEING